MPRKSPEQQILHYQQLVASAKTRKRESDRRQETNRKIILGAGIKALARREPKKAWVVVGIISPMLSERDRLALKPFLDDLEVNAQRCPQHETL